ncbi:hypothetical protein [Rhodoblastus sp.]|uniref:hypothetical protein n=1 Tax=Rhodoblastus sp. TaxID=1962975 RepID=UPI0025E2E938|nr:hypothetical protein [Rhodoblastus sp.]
MNDLYRLLGFVEARRPLVEIQLRVEGSNILGLYAHRDSIWVIIKTGSREWLVPAIHEAWERIDYTGSEVRAIIDEAGTVFHEYGEGVATGPHMLELRKMVAAERQRGREIAF